MASCILVRIWQNPCWELLGSFFPLWILHLCSASTKLGMGKWERASLPPKQVKNWVTLGGILCSVDAETFLSPDLTHWFIWI